MAVRHVAVLVQEVQRAEHTVAAGEESRGTRCTTGRLDSCS